MGNILLLEIFFVRTKWKAIAFSFFFFLSNQFFILIMFLVSSFQNDFLLWCDCFIIKRKECYWCKFPSCWEKKDFSHTLPPSFRRISSGFGCLCLKLKWQVISCFSMWMLTNIFDESPHNNTAQSLSNQNILSFFFFSILFIIFSI